jgi:hypothetical protein
VKKSGIGAFVPLLMKKNAPSSSQQSLVLADEETFAARKSTLLRYLAEENDFNEFYIRTCT